MSRYHLSRSYILRTQPGYIVLSRAKYHFRQHQSLFLIVKNKLYYEKSSSRLQRPQETLQSWSQTSESVHYIAPWRLPSVEYQTILQGALFGHHVFIPQLKRKNNVKKRI